MENWQDFSYEDFSSKEEHIEIQRFYYKIKSNWILFVASMLMSLFLSFLYIYSRTPLYSTVAKLLVNDDKTSNAFSGRSDLLDLNSLFGGKSSVDNEAEVLKTRHLMELVVQNLDANIIYFRYGKFKNVELYRSPFVFRLLHVGDNIESKSYQINIVGNGKIRIHDGLGFEAEVLYHQPFIIPHYGKVQIDQSVGMLEQPGKYTVQVIPFDDRVLSFMKGLNVSVTNKQVSTIDLIFNYPIPKKGEEILELLIKKYQESNINDKNLIADSTISFIDKRLEYIGQELGTIEGNIQKFKQSKNLADMSEQSKALVQNSTESVNDLAQIETKVSMFDALEEYLKDNSKNKRVLPAAIIPEDRVFSGLIERYNTLLLERDRKMLSATDVNPYILNLDQQISNLRKDMLSNLLSTRNTLLINRNELRERLQLMSGQIKNVPANERIYINLSRQQQIKQELYVFLLQKREETAISKTSNISNSKVIDPPKANRFPISPNKKLIAIIGLFIGVLIPLCGVYLNELFNTKIKDKESVTNLTKVPIIGEISNSREKQALVIHKQSRSIIAEQFRSLRTNLSFFLTQDENTILLTSNMSGEGKSFIAANLASALAISGKRIVVLEMDLRKPNLSNKLDIKSSIGFTNYIISSTMTEAEIIRPSETQENLFIISSGPIPPNPAETILNKKTEKLFSYLSKEFDYVIIDSPPIGLVTDAQLLSRYADLTLFVVRQNFTLKSQLNLVNSLAISKRMKRLSLIINDIKKSDAYGYGYSYGYNAYIQDESNISFWQKFKTRFKS